MLQYYICLAPVSVALPGAIPIDPSGVNPGRRYLEGDECRARSSLLFSAEKSPMRLSFESFRGSLPKSVFVQDRRYSRKVSVQNAFLASLRVLYVVTNCCRTDGDRCCRSHCPAISWPCRSRTGMAFRPTQSARLPCPGFHAPTLRNSFNPARISCGC